MQGNQANMQAQSTCDRWFVMTHLEPERLEPRLMDMQTTGRNGHPVPLRYFIPSQLLERQPIALGDDDYCETDSRDDKRNLRANANNEIRRALRRYVFLCASEKEIEQMLRADWNQGHLRLCHYKDACGNNASIDDGLMRRFINVCIDQRERFDVSPHVKRLAKGTTVIIRRGVFRDMPAEVYDISHTTDGVRMTLSVEFFGGTQDIRLYNKCLDDIEFEEQQDTGFAVSADFVERIEHQLLEIMQRKLSKGKAANPARQQADMRRLNELFLYHTMRIDNELLAARYDALMLVCAALRQDSDARSMFNARVKQHVNAFKPQTERSQFRLALLEAYIALFVSTRDNDYRQQAKELARDFLPDDHPLHGLLKCIKMMK